MRNISYIYIHIPICKFIHAYIYNICSKIHTWHFKFSLPQTPNTTPKYKQAFKQTSVMMYVLRTPMSMDLYFCHRRQSKI